MFGRKYRKSRGELERLAAMNKGIADEYIDKFRAQCAAYGELEEKYIRLRTAYNTECLMNDKKIELHFKSIDEYDKLKNDYIKVCERYNDLCEEYNKLKNKKK